MKIFNKTLILVFPVAIALAIGMILKPQKELRKVKSHFEKSKDTLSLKAAQFIVDNIDGHVSIDTSSLFKYRLILFTYDSLLNYRKQNATFPLTKVMDSLWTNLKLKESFDSDPVLRNKISDCDIISSSFLIKDIESALDTWNKSPYRDSISFKSFCDYILPYRRFEGISIEDWRSHFRNRHFSDVVNMHPLPVEKVIDSILNYYKDYSHTYNIMPDYPYLKIADFEISRRAYCDTKCWYNSMLFASQGIPVTVDIVPFWGNRNGSHQWNVLVLKGKSHPFESFWDLDKWKYKKLYNNNSSDSSFGEFRLPKVHRFSFTTDTRIDSLINNSEEDDLPNIFKNPKIKDVSEEYFDTSDIHVQLSKGTKYGEYAYLCVFNHGEWKPVEFGRIYDNKVSFRKMGRDIVYLPAYFYNGLIVPAGKAFYLNKKGSVKYFNPNSPRIDVAVYRKFPIYPYKFEWLKSLIGAKIQGANDPDFKNPTDLYTVDSSFNFLPTTVRLSNAKKFRYARLLYFGNKRSNLADLSFFEQSFGNLDKIKGNIICSKELNKDFVKNAFDDDFMTYVTSFVPGKKEFSNSWWLGLDFIDPKRIQAVQFCSRNDGNDVFVGKTYELFYWDNAWKSLGRKVAKTTSLTYTVPSGSIFLLKAIAGGSEERIFQIEKGKMVWR